MQLHSRHICDNNNCNDLFRSAWNRFSGYRIMDTVNRRERGLDYIYVPHAQSTATTQQISALHFVRFRVCSFIKMSERKKATQTHNTQTPTKYNTANKIPNI